MSKRLYYIYILIICCIFSSTQFYYLNASSPYNNKPIPKWLSEQITNDLRSFSQSGITQKMLDDVIAQSKPEWGLVRYKIFNNNLSIVHYDSGTVFDKKLKLMVGKLFDERFNIITEALNTLCLTTPLPNVDFILSLHDSLDLKAIKGPVFAFAKNVSSEKIILIPDFEALTGNTEILATVEAEMPKYPWKTKLAKAFWRGTTSGGEYTDKNFLSYPRSSSVTTSLNFPERVDARFSSLIQCQNPEEIKTQFSRYFGTFTSVAEHLKYKYLILIDGNSCAYSRAYWQLFSNSLVMKQTSPNIQWYYRALKPYVHYIPLKENLEDLIEQMNWAERNEEKVQAIIQNAQKFAKENLSKSDIYHHLYAILTEYAKLQK